MTFESINPDNLPTPQTYTQVIATTGRRLVFVAGQEPEDSQGNVVGLGDLAACRHVRCLPTSAVLLRRPARGLIGSPRSRSSLLHHRPEYLPVIEGARVSLFGDHKPVDTLVGVEWFSRAEYLIEVDAIAVLD